MTDVGPLASDRVDGIAVHTLVEVVSKNPKSQK